MAARDGAPQARQVAARWHLLKNIGDALERMMYRHMPLNWIYGERFTDRETLKSEVFNYIEVDYNEKSRHSTLDYVSPMEFER